MNVKLRLMTVGALFFVGQALIAQENKKDTTDSAKNIDEVIVLGYSKVTTKPKDVTASTTISSEVIENRPNVSFLNSIQGAAPGVNISSVSGSPGSAKIDIIIRGLGSLNASTDPLYVIDGISYSAAEFRNINVNDIADIRILRDAAGTSIYGNRGANGVIVITTKQGKYNSTFKLNYTSMTGIAVLPQNKYKMANRDEYFTLQKMYGQGFGSTLTEDQYKEHPDTDWLDHFFKPALTQQHDLNFTSGGQNLSSYTSIGYLEQNGIVPTTDFKRFTFRNNANGKSNDGRFTFNSQIALAYSKRNQLNQETNNNINNNIVQNPLHGSLMGLPYIKPNTYTTGQSLYDAIGQDFNGGKYIYVLEDILRGKNIPSWFTQTSILTNLAASYKLTPELTLSNKIGADYKRNDRVFARAPWSYLAIVVANTSTPVLKYPGFETISTETDFTLNNVTSLNYHKDFGKHTLDVGAYFDYLKSNYNIYQQIQNGLNAVTYVPGAATGYVPTEPNAAQGLLYVPQISGLKIKAGGLSYFGTVDYDYDSKYGISGVVRRDGSYRFVDDNKWGTFWSVAGRWNIDREAFLEDSIFDMLKLRASYGTQGNQNVLAANYGVNPLFTATNLVRDLNVISSPSTPGYNGATAIYLSQVANKDLRWEEVSQANIGLDFQLFNKKLEGNIDVYKKVTDNLYNDINVSAVTGIYSYNGNNGKMENKGIELLLRYNIFNKENFKLSVFANGSYNENKIKSINGGFQQQGDVILEEGRSAYEWYLVPFVGANPETGQFQFLAADGSITENPTNDDRRRTGKSFLPKYQGGFGVNVEYKGFFLDTLFSFQKDVWKVDNQFMWLMDPTSLTEAGANNVSTDLLNSWTPTNTNTNEPSIFATNYQQSLDSDKYLYDSSFLKFRSFTLGYNVPKSLLNNGFVKALRIFVQGENVAVWTKWRGFDPEGFNFYPLGTYPNPRTFSLGATVEF